MVQGLGFLSKKSWHTKNIANQEKVWIAEEREKDEKARTAELAKQIQQEREDEELSKIAGRKKLDRGIDWMYTGHHKESEMAKLDAAKESEEYLLGKKFAAPSGKVVGDLDAAADGHDGVNAVVAAMDHKGANLESTHSNGAFISTISPNEGDPSTEDSVAQRNEAFRIRHEDPMFAVSLQAVRKQKSIEERKDLYERAGFAVKAVKLDDSKAHHDDRRKKSSKAMKRSKDEVSSNQSSKDEENDRKRKRRKKHKHRKSHATSDNDDSYSDESEYGRRRKSSHRDKGFHSSRKTHSSGERRRDSGDRDGRYQTHDHRELPSQREEPMYTKQSTDKVRYASDFDAGEYGLQGSQTTGSHLSRNSDLGPDQLLLQRKNEDRDAERRRLREISSKRRHRSASERDHALMAMERDAKTLSSDRHQSRPNRDGEEETRHDDELRAAKFLHRVSQVAHDMNEGPDPMSRRTQRDQGRNQRKHSDTFM